MQGVPNTDDYAVVRYSLKPCNQNRLNFMGNEANVICEKDERKILDYFRKHPINFAWYDEYVGTESIQDQLDAKG
jgi:hypothetical protein